LESTTNLYNGGAAGTSGTGGYGAGKKPVYFHDAWNEYACYYRKDKNLVYLLVADCIMGLSKQQWLQH
jgi:hypothetical protein